MPNRPPTVCAEPSCPRLVSSGRCDDHQLHRPSAAARGYDRAHRRRRARYLTQHPTCECAGCNRCTPSGCTKPSTDLDHIDGNARNNPADGSNWQALDHACHSVKTQRHDRGPRDDDPPPSFPPVFA